jgi:hypothetical protein
MTKTSIRYVAEMENGEYLFTMYDDTGYSALTVLDFADANLYETEDDEILFNELRDIKSGKIKMDKDMGCEDFKRVVKVEMKLK